MFISQYHNNSLIKYFDINKTKEFIVRNTISQALEKILKLILKISIFA